MTAAVIQLDQLSKRYGALQALDGVSLNVPAGCLYGLLGP
ncbi:MAG TPA: lysozyme, partial [Synechococcales bacterium UBA8647]|nr:lysozyme [Synechococcales bacterium UBA8647]